MFTVTVGLVTSLVAGVAPAAVAAPHSAALIPHDRPIPVKPVVSHYHAPATMPAWHATKPSWPTGTATVSLPARPTAGKAPSSAAAPVRAGTLPVWLARNDGHGTADTGKDAAAGAGSAERITALPQTVATAAGVHGVLMTVQRTDSTNGDTHATVSVDYRGFQDAFGGDWAARLHLAQLPACAATTPDKPSCRKQTPLVSTTDKSAATISANVTLPGPPTTNGAAAAAPAIVLAVTSSASDSSGDFTATSLKPSGSWQAGGSADSFTWSYPVPVPPVPGGLEPTVALSYDSQSDDGLTSSTNNQPSWIGDGWEYSPGYIERSYTSCSQNPAGATRTGDNCWSANNTLTLSLGGHTSILVRDDATGTYHPQGDSAERVQYLTGAVNGAQNGEYFVVTATDGTQYTFGLNQLPGWNTGNATTNSVWTEPVYATTSGQPCYNPTFSQSSCQQAYRWNLDYVVDTHSDAVSYFYATESNSYVPDNNAGQSGLATASYVRAGYLTKIQYGQRAGQVYTTSPAAQVLFTTTGRCTQSTCDPSTLSNSTAVNWPDVPYDLNCASGATCSVTSPSFWSEYLLSSIQTQALVGTTETPVDSWSLTHTYPATQDALTSPVTWLSSITHTGQDPNSTGSSTASSPITLPPVVFTGAPLANRVQLSDGNSSITRQRLTGIITETGEGITVGYSGPACGTSTPTDPSQNTALCFPDYWTPPNQTLRTDWFNKYVVTSVTETDPLGGSANDTIVTTYSPVGAAAWHYNDNPITPTGQRTWDQWRGYSGMVVSTGTAPDPVTDTQYTYFRGMNGDTLPNNGTRSVTVADSRGDAAVADANQYAGDTYETLVYNGSAVVTDTVADPWSSAATASQALPGLPTEQSFLTGTADTRVYTPLANGTTRETQTLNTHDAHGRVTQINDLGDVTIASDDLCTTTSYADNTNAWILDKVAESATVSVACTATPSLPANAVSDARTYYDQSTTLGAAPSVGDATETLQANSYTGNSPNLIETSADTVDQYGRIMTATDADTNTTHTAYTPATGAEPTSITVTDPKNFATTTTYDSLRDLPLSKTDPAKFVTKEQYDALGRLTAVFRPGAGSAANTYSYTVSNSGPSVVDTNTLGVNGSYRLSETLYDALLRAREVQAQTPDNGRLVTDTIYNTDGWVSETTDPYYNPNAVAATYVQAQAGDVPSSTAFTYDRAGRKTAATADAAGSQTWQTSYAYGGNTVTTVPPTGATATTTITDARGDATDLYQYHTGVPTDPVNDPAADYSDTHYTYTPAGKQATVTDAAGNTWSYSYDLMGRQTSAQDPDTGTTTTVYDNAGLVTSVTDGRGKQTTTSYDVDGRKTARYDTTGNAAPSASNETAAWTYDTVKMSSGTALGYPAAITSISGGDTYTQTVLQYNAYGKPAAVKATLTGTDAAIFPSTGAVTSYGYTTSGYPVNRGDPTMDGLACETVATAYDNFDEPISIGSTASCGGSWSPVSAVGYSEYGQPLRYTSPSGSGSVSIDMQYDPQTHALTDVQTSDSNLSTAIDDLTYKYVATGVSKGAGLVTTTTDNQNAGATVDTQCYTYDYAQRLAAAWTATDGCTNTPAAGNSATVGGPSPYWQSWTYDAAGDRLTQSDHDTTGTTANDTTTTYAYPPAGSTTDQPHTLASTTATGPQATQNTASYTYDASGNTSTITGGATGNQSLTWNDQDQLASDATSSGTINYVYDAEGNLLLVRDPGQTTLYFGDAQLVLNTTTGATSGTRFYTINGTVIAAHSTTVDANNTQILVPDRQGTNQLSVDTATNAVSRRQYLPFGQPRGTPPTTWPGNLGYVGGTADPTITLENLGAREYNSATGRFLSPDPIFALGDPTQMAGYDYAGNNPVTGSDPTGLLRDGGGQCGVYVACASSGQSSTAGGGKNSGNGSTAGGGSSGTWFSRYQDIATKPAIHRPSLGLGGLLAGQLGLQIGALLNSIERAEQEAEAEAAKKRSEDAAGNRLILKHNHNSQVGKIAEILGIVLRIETIPQPQLGPDRITIGENLYAFGNKTQPRGARLSDFGADSEYATVGPYNPSGPTDNVGGASTFTDPKLAPVTGQYHALPAGTELPPGLGAIADGEDAGGQNPVGHVTIYPTVPMSYAEFQMLFQSLPWQWAGKK